MDRCVEFVEKFALNLVGDLGSPTGEGLVFLNDKKAIGLGNRLSIFE